MFSKLSSSFFFIDKTILCSVLDFVSYFSCVFESYRVLHV